MNEKKIAKELNDLGLGAMPSRIPCTLDARELLSIGFETALLAMIPQLKTVKISGGITAWIPPHNPFAAAAALDIRPTQEPEQAELSFTD